VEELAAVQSQAELKSLLESIAASGEGGSALAGVSTSIETLSIDDAKKQKENPTEQKITGEAD